ncbi:hypothetical protein IX83_02015 [Basilea psittacipulmonis DSM 24701]|uniref:Uncharacterized protein n=2 Tax=Basilea TaxID=1472344 RepID=A0A077DBQ8_9BURK|nr:hypothetical protein IX83_02015 [Basilea psittacipulmonis DSM 24701]
MMFYTEKDLYQEFDQVYTDLNDVPFDALAISEEMREFNPYWFLRDSQGDLFGYLIEPFKEWQPRTYEYLSQGKFFYAMSKSDYPGTADDSTKFGIIVNDIVCYIGYTKYPYEKYQKDYSTIPLSILNSWLYRSDGWHVAEMGAYDIFRSVLPSIASYQMSPISSVIKKIVKKRRVLPEYTEFLEAKFNHPFRQSYHLEEFRGGKYFELRSLLDTRSTDDGGQTGFQLFVSSHNQERNVYVVPRLDIMQMKKLSDPAEAIDRYAAHLFSKAESEFNFLDYAEDF